MGNVERQGAYDEGQHLSLALNIKHPPVDLRS